MSTSALAHGAATTRGRIKVRVVAVVAAVLATVVIWTVSQLAGMDLRSPAFGGSASYEIGIAFVIVTSALAALAGWGLLALLERFTRRAPIVWLVIASVACLLSLGAPWSGTGVTTGNRVVLTLMHLAVGLVLVPVLYRSATRRTS